MACGKGFLATSGAKKASTWGTPVAIGAGYGLEFNSESINADPKHIVDTQVSGNAARLFGDKGPELHNGEMDMDVKYEGMEMLFAMALGTAAAPVQQGTDNAYKHVLQVNGSLEGTFLTLAINKGVAAWEWPTAKVASFTLSLKQGQRAKCKFKFIASSLNFNTASGTNNQTTMGSITIPTNRDFLLFSQMKVLINSQSGAALTPGTDDVYINDFDCTFSRPFPVDDVTTQNAPLIDEPIQDGFLDVTGTMHFSKYQSGSLQTLLTDLLAKNRKKMRVQWTGRIASGGTNFQFTMYFPDLQFTTGSGAPVGGPGRIPLDLKFEAHRVVAVPTGYPAGYLDPVTIEIVNQRNTGALS